MAFIGLWIWKKIPADGVNAEIVGTYEPNNLNLGKNLKRI